MYQLIFYAPNNAVEAVKAAIFAAGGGRIGNYACCAWQTTGQGQFTPLPKSNPAIGIHEKQTIVHEVKVELVVARPYIKAVLTALRAAHPYEEPAYIVTECVQFDN